MDEYKIHHHQNIHVLLIGYQKYYNYYYVIAIELPQKSQLTYVAMVHYCVDHCNANLMSVILIGMC